MNKLGAIKETGNYQNYIASVIIVTPCDIVWPNEFRVLSVLKSLVGHSDGHHFDGDHQNGQKVYFNT